MGVETTPLGLHKPDGKELARNGDNEIAFNAQKTQELAAAIIARLAMLEGEAGFTGSGLDLADSVISALVAGNTATRGAMYWAPPPNGVDDTAALTAFFNANPGRTKALYQGGVYKVTSALPNPGKLVGNGAVLDCQTMADGTALGQKYCIDASGSIGSATTVTNALSIGDTALTVSSTVGLSVGMWVVLSNTEQPVSGMTRTDRVKGEMGLIDSIAGTTVTLDSGVTFNYGTTGLKIQPLTVLDNVDISDLQIIMGGVASAHNGIAVRYATNVNLDKLKIDGAEETAISLETVSGFSVTRCKNSGSTSSTTLGLSGYGVAVMHGSQHGNVSNCHFRNNRHHVAGGGLWPAIHIKVLNNHGRNSNSAAYDCHESTFHWLFQGNTAVKATHGIYVRGQHITVKDNQFHNISAEGISVQCWDLVDQQWGIEIIGNRVRKSGWGLSAGSRANTATARLKDIVISGNTFELAGTNPIRLDAFDGATVADNHIRGGTGSGIKITGASSGDRSTDLRLSNNHIRDTTGSGLEIAFVDGVEISGGKSLRPALYGVLIDSSLAITITGYLARGGTGSTYDSLRVTGSTGLVVSGGYYASPRYAIFTTTTNDVIVVGAEVKDTVHGTKINCDAANKVITPNL